MAGRRPDLSQGALDIELGDLVLKLNLHRGQGALKLARGPGAAGAVRMEGGEYHGVQARRHVRVDGRRGRAFGPTYSGDGEFVALVAEQPALGEGLP